MQRQSFPKEEALEKVGKTVKTKIEFSGVPKGTVGEVLRPFEGDFDKQGNIISLPIRWNRFQRDKLIDWFSKQEYYKFLEEIR
ncbi:MAG: hypothetical protein AB1393_14160 [Candidatus Edwardsbacteria bacterium]